MMNIRFLGCGAAGNKAAIHLVNEGVININHTLLINSTIKDIPAEYQEKSVIFSTEEVAGGCGKERDLGKGMLLNKMRLGAIDPETWIEPTDQMIIICGSTEGGSGSASIPILAKYFKEVVGIPVLVCLFFGFEDDIRGLQNTIEVCQELSDEYGVIGISNKKFMRDANGNKIKAEKLANAELAKRIRILFGLDIVESEQNIDDTDLYKLVTTPGFMEIGKVDLDNVKSVSQYSSFVSDSIADSKSLDSYSKSAKRIGLIFNINERTENAIDFEHSVIKETFGTPYELFSHIQNATTKEWMAYIAVGIKMPINYLEDTYASYIERSSQVNKEKDNFFNKAAELKGNEEDSIFNTFGTKRNVIGSTQKSKRDFYDSLGVEKDEQAPKESKKKDPKVTTVEY